jgi:hypothetical protein
MEMESRLPIEAITNFDEETTRRAQILKGIIDKQPELRIYSPRGNVARAKLAFQGLNGFLKEDSSLLPQLQEKYAAHPKGITMLVFPKESLVFAQMPDGVYALAPVLTCTLNAIHAIPLKDDHRYAVVHASLSYKKLEMAEQSQIEVFNYDPREITAENYIAYAVCGFFRNEVFRKRIDVPSSEQK